MKRNTRFFFQHWKSVIEMISREFFFFCTYARLTLRRKWVGFSGGRVDVRAVLNLIFNYFNEGGENI